MKTNRILFLFFVLILVANISYSFQTNSSNYRQSPLIVSSGGEIVNSSSYKNYVATGIIAGVINSSTYKNWLGFFYGWLLADGQPCTSNNQCEGGFCCSNVCSSSSCPTTTVPSAAPGGGGVGGGGGGANISGILPGLKDYSISPSNVKVKLALGESVEKILSIRNTGKGALTIHLEIEAIRDYLFLSDNVLHLEAGDEAEIILNFIGKNVGNFVGEIVARVDEVEKSIPIIFEVITKLVLFDAKLDIPASFAEVEPGDELKTQITLLNVGAPENVDVFATYFIKDLRGNIIYEETETFAVEKQISYPKLFKIHESTVPGSYVAVVEIRYADSFAVSSQLFRVVEKKAVVVTERITKNTTLMLFLMFILVGIISILIYKRVSIGKRGKKNKKVK